MKKILFIFAVLLISCNTAEKRLQEREKFVADSIAEVKATKEQQRRDSIWLVEIAREDSIKKAKHAETVKNTVKINSYYLSSPNSVGGVDAYFYYTNLNDKTIKYLTWEGYPLNAVGDAVSCTVRDRVYYRGRDTGPIKKGQKGGGCWSNAWYNNTAKKMIIKEISIEYMDGSSFVIEGVDLYLVGIKKPE